MVEQDIVDLGRKKVFAAKDDHFIDSPGNLNEPALLD